MNSNHEETSEQGVKILKIPDYISPSGGQNYNFVGFLYISGSEYPSFAKQDMQECINVVNSHPVPLDRAENFSICKT